ncbi:MAG: serine hydrolase [Acidobacteria bacterium]|nr:serine hydrolase [Acidobacteriota bacterium]
MIRRSTRFAVGFVGAAVFSAALAPAALAQSTAPDDAGTDAGLPVASPGTVGMSADALGRIAPAMQAYVDDGRLAAVMTMVARRGQVVHWEAVGTRDTASGDPLERDDIFRIYSMTKPVTSVATMILVEEGKVALDDPLSKFVPEFGDVKVLAAGGERVAADGPITVEHLLTHTSGLSYGFFGDSAVDALYVEANPLAAAEGLDDFARRIAELPLIASPGTRWTYSVSTDILGRIVEVASGQPFDAFVKERILDPLDMDDTAFWVAEEKRGRFMANYAQAGDALVIADSPTEGEYTSPPNFPSGGGGLTSTASDYIRFAQMLLEGGALGDVRILGAETVAKMRENRLPDALVPIELGTFLSPGYGFGLGFAVMMDADSSPEPDHNGVYRWAGAANTFFWIDPEAELVGMVWTQFMPFAAYDLEREFQTLVYEAIE